MKKKKREMLDSKKKIDKIRLWIRKTFCEDAYYYKELNTRATFPKFIVKRWIMIFTVLVIPILILIVAAILDEGMSAISYQSVSNSIMYFGSVCVGVVVYYFSWAQALRDNNSLRIRINVESLPNDDNDEFVFYSKKQAQNNIESNSFRYTSEECNYIKLAIRNMSSRSPLAVYHLNSYYSYRNKGNQVKDAGKAFISDINENDFLEFKESQNFMIGMPCSFFNRTLLTEKINCWYYLLFKLVNLDGNEAYLVYVDFVSEGCSNYRYYLLNAKKYRKLVKKHGLNVLTKVGWGNQLNLYK